MDRFRIRALEKILATDSLNADDHRAAVAMLREGANPPKSDTIGNY